MSSTPKTTTSKISELSKMLLAGAVIILLICAIVYAYWMTGKTVWNTVSTQNMADEKWSSLAQASPAHLTLVTTYRNCRTRAFGGSVEECLLVANDYGKLMGIDSDLTAIIHELKSTSDSIIKK